MDGGGPYIGPRSSDAGSSMELAVLLKAVPRSEEIRYDPARRAVVREGPELVVNPFDQRALRVALELKGGGDRVTVLSLGPPPVAPFLREARAIGADRALHLCDPAFAGSDVLATSTVLASALRRLPAELVVAGARSTDGDTGLVAPAIAARLGVPVVTSARAVRRAAEANAVEADVDTPTGWATVAVDLPAVVTVGEKVGKPLSVTPEQFARTGAESVETVGPGPLGLSIAEVGAFGSPTTVEAVREAAIGRLGRQFAEGSPDERVRNAVAALTPLLGRESPPPAPLPWPPPRDAQHEVLVLASGPHGEVEPDILGILSLMRRALPSYALTVAVYGPSPTPEDQRRLEAAGALGGYLLDPGSRPFDSADVARGLASLLQDHPRIGVVACLASLPGREVAGQLAATRSLGTVADAVAVGSDPAGALEWSKPSFGGTTFATVRCRSAPVVVTMPPGLGAAARDGRSDGGLRWADVPPPRPVGRVRCRRERAEPAESPEAEGAEVVVAVGIGVGGPEGIRRLVPVARRWGAAVVGTRRVVDAGWLPVRRQVGLTGRALAPRLAILLGVRGAMNHMVGWARAGAVLAVNQDPDAPVFGQADVGIVGAIDEVVPELAEPLARALGPPSPS